jgi:outer membrane lipoprotein SlyB
MKLVSTIAGTCLALSFVAVGCGSSPPKQERTITTTTTTTAAVDDYRRRPGETVYEVPVSSVHAVVGPDEKRCWIEREQVRGSPSVGGAVAGAAIGGILGHQIGAGRGRDVATVGGAVVGGAVGANAGRSTTTRDVQHCETVANATPDYWDVSYEFRGVEHHVQMTNPPGSTITVNRDGIPRV